MAKKAAKGKPKKKRVPNDPSILYPGADLVVVGDTIFAMGTTSDETVLELRWPAGNRTRDNIDTTEVGRTGWAAEIVIPWYSSLPAGSLSKHRLEVRHSHYGPMHVYFFVLREVGR